MLNRTGRIYKATDKILGKSYIGQTINSLDSRKNQHYKQAFNKNNDISYYNIFYKMIRFLGKDNFYWEILEDDIPLEKLNEKEIFYINKYNSFENGYNSTIGGRFPYTNKIDENIVNSIIKLLTDSQLTQTEIAKKFNITREMVSDINCGETWYNSSINYPIRENLKYFKNKFSNKEIIEIVELLKNSNLNYKEISKKYNCNPTTIKNINNGIIHKINNINYPIRNKCFNHLNINDIKIIVNFLIENKDNSISLSYLSKKYNYNRKTISNINNGIYHRKKIESLFKNISFPIKK